MSSNYDELLSSFSDDLNHYAETTQLQQRISSHIKENENRKSKGKLERGVSLFQNDYTIVEEENDMADASKFSRSLSNPASLSVATSPFNNRLENTLKIWYLPHTTKQKAADLLTHADVGNFIVRNSEGREDCMAITVRSAENSLSYHYLIVVKEHRVGLENSKFIFTSLTNLLQFYRQRNDDLSIQLTLPNLLLQCDEEELSKFTSLGEAFWICYPSMKESLDKKEAAKINKTDTGPEASVDTGPESSVTTDQSLNSEEDVLRNSREEIPKGFVQRLRMSFESHSGESPPSSPVQTPQEAKSNPVIRKLKHLHVSPKSIYALPTKELSSQFFESGQADYSEPWDQSSMHHLLAQHSPNKPNERENEKSPFRVSVAPGSVMSATKLRDSLAGITVSYQKPAGSELYTFFRSLFSGKVSECELLPQWITNFAQCTIDCSSRHPTVIFKKIQQFITGMSHYTLITQQQNLRGIVQIERERLSSKEYINVALILECVLTDEISRVLRDHLYQVVSEEHKRSSAMEDFYAAVNMACNMVPSQLGMKKEFEIDNTMLKSIRHYFTKIGETYSPIEKMNFLLSAMELVFYTIQKPECEHTSTNTLKAEDILPSLVYCIAQSRFYSAEVEVAYVEGLLPSSVSQGEAGYYLNLMQAAIEAIKTLKTDRLENGTSQTQAVIRGRQRGVVRVVVLDESNDALSCRMFPLSANSTVKDLNNLIAYRMNIYNPTAYSLFLYNGGKERRLSDNDNPMQIRREFESSLAGCCLFIYKRSNAITILPRNLVFDP